MIRPILRYGADVLHQPASPVAGITPDILRLVDDMTGGPVAGALVEVSSSEAQAVVPTWNGYGSRAGPSDADGTIRHFLAISPQQSA